MCHTKNSKRPIVVINVRPLPLWGFGTHTVDNSARISFFWYFTRDKAVALYVITFRSGPTLAAIAVAYVYVQWYVYEYAYDDARTNEAKSGFFYFVFVKIFFYRIAFYYLHARGVRARTSPDIPLARKLINRVNASALAER